MTFPFLINLLIEMSLLVIFLLPFKMHTFNIDTVEPMRSLLTFSQSNVTIFLLHIIYIVHYMFLQFCLYN